MERIFEHFSGNQQMVYCKQKEWLKNSLDLLQSDLESNKPMTWASFHACCFQLSMISSPAFTALLPLFYEKAAMIKHAIDILTSFLHPGQIQLWHVTMDMANNS